MLGYSLSRDDLNSRQASARVEGLESSKKRKRLSGRLETKIVVSSASRLGGRRENWNSVSFGRKSLCFKHFSFFSWDKNWMMTRFLSCLGEKKLAQLTSTLREIQKQSWSHL